MTLDEKELAGAVIMLFAAILMTYAAVLLFLGTPHFMATIVSDSMKPSFERGDIVIIKNMSSYYVGDIIAFKRSDGIYVHRIISEEDNTYRTMGDNTNAPDQWTVRMNNVLGRVIFVIPKLGWINLWLSGK